MDLPAESLFTRYRFGCSASSALAAGGLLCLAYGYFVEPYWRQVRHVRLQTTKLRLGARAIRIVQISDIHSDPRPRLEQRLPQLVAATRPDIIVFTGDMLNGVVPLFEGTGVELDGQAQSVLVGGTRSGPRLRACY